MDFDEIKNAWKNSFEDKKLLNKGEIEAMLKIKSRSGDSLRKVKRNYRIELIFNIVGSIFLILWILKNINSPGNYILSVAATLFLGVMTWICWINYKRVKNIVITSDQLKLALVKTISGIEYYVNFYKSKLTKYVLMPFAIMFGMLIGFYAKTGEIDFNKIGKNINPNAIVSNINANNGAFRIDSSEIFALLLIFVVTSLLMLPVLQYYNKKMYKQHLDKLKQCLTEFEDIQEESNNN